MPYDYIQGTRRNTVSGAALTEAEPTLVHRLISAATTNATSVKTSGGEVFGWHLSNDNAAFRYLKLYNKASAPVVGTDVPLLTIKAGAGTSAHSSFAQGITFSTGIAFALTVGIADTDVAAVAVNDIVVNLFYR